MFKFLKEKLNNLAENCESVKELEKSFPNTYNRNEEMYSTCFTELFLKFAGVAIVALFIYYFLKSLIWI